MRVGGRGRVSQHLNYLRARGTNLRKERKDIIKEMFPDNFSKGKQYRFTLK